MVIINNVPNTSGAVEGLKVTITTDDGYIFDGDIRVNFENDFGSSSYVMSVNGDLTEATYTFFADYGNITITGATMALSLSVEVDNNISGTTYATNVVDGAITITVTAPESTQKRFIEPLVYYTTSEGSNASKSLISQGSTNVVSCTITDADLTELFQLEGEYSVVVLTQIYLSNCEAVEPIPEFYQIGEEVTISVATTQNSEFSDPDKCFVLYQNDFGFDVKEDMIVADDRLTASITLTVPDSSFLRISCVGEVVSPTGGNYGSINVYVVTDEDLSTFATKRFFIDEGTTVEGVPTYTEVDLGSYVNSLKRIYTNISATTPDVLKCGDYTTDIDVFQPDNDIITLSFGQVTVPNYNNDSTDFESVTQLFLPFNGFVDISSEYVGKTISLFYMVNVVTGMGVARLECDGVVFQLEEIEPSQNIVYRTGMDQQTIGEASWNELLLYGTEPYLYHKWYESKNHNAINADSKEVNLSNMSGFIKLVDLSDISTPQMLYNEQKMIIEALESGVYIE